MSIFNPIVMLDSTPAANGADQQIRPASSIGSNSETTPAHETRKLPAYTGNENSRYGLPAEEKAKLKQERERAKREKVRCCGWVVVQYKI